MARRFKFYGKKRGDRTTGSRKLARYGETAFFFVLLLLGAGALVATVISLIVPEWRVHRDFVKTTCVVLSEPQIEEIDLDGTPQFRPRIEIEYEVGERRLIVVTYDLVSTAFSDRADAEKIIKRFTSGESYDCWYDPDKPTDVVLAYRWWVWLVMLLPFTISLLGLAGIGYTLLLSGTSQERRAALVKQVVENELFEGMERAPSEYPGVPDDADLKNSPGTTLAYRLPIATTPGWKLFANFMACLSWNGIASIFVVMAIRSHFTDAPDWYLTLFMLPFVAIGIWLIYYSLRQLFITTGVGPTRLEISQHPLIPGEEYEVLITQGGKLSVKKLELLLVCQEQATYRQGTDTVSEAQVVYRDSILDVEDVEIEAGLPFETRGKFRVPAAAMHSFKADNNSVQWLLSVRGETVRWPEYRRDFPVIVRPTKSGDRD